MKTVFGDRIAPTLVSCALFSERGLCGFGNRRLLLHSAVGPPAERNAKKMKLKIRYDEAYQVLDLDEKVTEQLWVSLDLDGGEGLTQAEREKRIQEAFDERYNKPEYNCWHRHARHTVSLGLYSDNGEDDDDRDGDPLVKSVSNKRLFLQDEFSRAEREEYEDVCEWIRRVLKDKPQWSAAFIAVHMDGEQTKDYAASIGVDPTTVTHWLRRAEKKLRENYKNRQF